MTGTGGLDMLIVLTAQVLPLLVAAVAAVVWFTLPSRQKRPTAVLAVTAVVIAFALAWTAGKVHVDPRPFVVDPTRPPLFPHPADNGFPSDHTYLAATAALVVATRRRWTGSVLLALAVVGGLARVLARVHHLQDIAGGLVIALLAVTAASIVLHYIARLRPRTAASRTAQPATDPGSR